MAYELRFAAATKEHFNALTAPERATVFEAIERQLLFEPLVETRNRKPLRPNPIAPWELRIGDLRVFYEVEAGGEPVVRILVIGKKIRNSLIVGGQELKL
ncbi:MAG: hypothetical protein U0Q16_04900 [Bryobacteraceae bacterium]